jgi:hypothetical protein
LPLQEPKEEENMHVYVIEFNVAGRGINEEKARLEKEIHQHVKDFTSW